MKQTIEMFGKLAGRLKLASALLALFFSGALAAMAVSSWYHDRVISQIHGSYGGRISAYNADIRRLKNEVDQERKITREQLHDLAVQLKAQAADTDQIADDMGRLMQLMEIVSQTAEQAATTARSAASTASTAAKNAANANIKVRESTTDWVKEK